MLVLVTVSLILLLAAAAFSVDIAYMQLVREELHIATDAAAKAAVTKLSLGGSKDEAISQAISVAAKNRVAGAPLTIDTSHVKIGCSTFGTGERWTFTKDVTPLTAASVTIDMSSGPTPGKVNLFFGQLFGTSTFAAKRTSTAAFVRNKVCLCFDRSRSMTFDTTGTNEHWPTSTSGWPNGVPSSVGPTPRSRGNNFNYRQIYPPCNNSRWNYLSIAANTFLDVLDKLVISNSVETQVALLTWGSSINNADSKDGNKYYTYTGGTLKASSSLTTFSAYTLDSSFVTSYDAIRTAISTKTGTTMLGGTDMNTGLQKAIDQFTSTDGLHWNKIIILFSDGCISPGMTDPVTDAAVNAAEADIVVHTVGFLLNSTDSANGEPTLQKIATKTGGRYFRATDAASLKKAFQDLARTLPVILTQ